MTSSANLALVVARHGGCEVFDVAPSPRRDPGPHQVQVQVAASGINFTDVYQREGIYPTNPPYVAGGEGAGSVVAVGAEVAGIAVGDVVAWATQPGSHAQFVNVDAAVAVPVPPDLDPELAAAAMLQGMTAHYLVNSTYTVQPGDSVLIHAAAGGTGQLLVQLAVARGARVIATAGTAAKRDKALELGAHVVLRYDEFETSDGLAAAIRDANGGAGVTVAYDGVGRATFDASLAALDVRGMLVLFGASSGQVPPFELQRLNYGGSLFVTRPTLAHYLRTRDELLFRASSIFESIADGSLVIDVGGRFALTDAVAAYAALESRATMGKLLLLP